MQLAQVAQQGGAEAALEHRDGGRIAWPVEAAGEVGGAVAPGVEAVRRGLRQQLQGDARLAGVAAQPGQGGYAPRSDSAGERAQEDKRGRAGRPVSGREKEG